MLSILNPDFLFDLSELLQGHFNGMEENESGETPNSYYHFVSDKYENGKQVSHKEKVVKDGKVVKDVNETKAIEDHREECSKKNEPCAVTDNKELMEEIKKLKERVKQLENQNNSVAEQNKRLAKENEKLTNENKCIYNKLDAIRKVF